MITSRNDVTEMIVAAKVSKGLKWEEVAEKVGLSKEWVTAACLGQMALSAEQAATVAEIFGLDAEAGGKQGNLDFLLQFVVHGHTELGFKVAAEAVHELFHFVHFAHHQFVLRAVRNVEQHFLGVEDIVVVQQRGMERIIDSLAHAAFPFAVSRTHNGYPTIF